MNSEPFYTVEMGLGVNTITHAGYDIRLIALDPYPETPEQQITLSVDHRLTRRLTTHCP